MDDTQRELTSARAWSLWKPKNRSPTFLRSCAWRVRRGGAAGHTPAAIQFSSTGRDQRTSIPKVRDWAMGRRTNRIRRGDTPNEGVSFEAKTFSAGRFLSSAVSLLVSGLPQPGADRPTISSCALEPRASSRPSRSRGNYTSGPLRKRSFHGFEVPRTPGAGRLPYGPSRSHVLSDGDTRVAGTRVGGIKHRGLDLRSFEGKTGPKALSWLDPTAVSCMGRPTPPPANETRFCVDTRNWVLRPGSALAWAPQGFTPD